MTVHQMSLPAPADSRRRICRHCRKPYVNQPHGHRRNHTKAGYAGFRGYCPRCYCRWRDHGYPESGPPAERVQVVGRSAAGRLEDYAELRSWGLTLAEAATRMQVTRRTVQRYEAALRDRDPEQVAA